MYDFDDVFIILLMEKKIFYENLRNWNKHTFKYFLI